MARAAGETAPLLFTALFSELRVAHEPLEPTPLAVLIFEFSGSPSPAIKLRLPGRLRWSWSPLFLLSIFSASTLPAAPFKNRRFSNGYRPKNHPNEWPC